MEVLVLAEPYLQPSLEAAIQESDPSAEVSSLDDFDSALTLLAEVEPDVLLLDWLMSASRGSSNIGRLKVAAPKTALIVLMPRSDPAIESAALSAGAQECITLDDCEPTKLHAAIFKSIERARNEQTLRMEIISLRAFNHSDHTFAQIDPLTGLVNRKRFAETVDVAITRAKREVRMMALLYLDIDGFKHLNDQYGHDVGDEALRWFANLLRDNRHHTGTVGRMGGDEFVVLMDDVRNRAEVAAAAHKIFQLLDRAVELQGVEVKLDTSIGIAMYPMAQAQTSADLIRHADTARCHAKQRGHADHVLFFNDTLQTKLNTEQAIRDTLSESLACGDTHVVYQPIYSYRSESICSAEVLFRWPRDDGFSTNDIIKIAEASRSVGQIDRFALTAAVDEMREYNLSGLRQLNVNASVLSLDQDYLRLLIDHMTQAGTLPFKLCVEITETAVSSNFRGLIDWVRCLRKQNIAVALDDFGTGYASLKYIQQLDVDVLKLDRELAKDVENDSSARSICQAAIAMAHSLGTTVVAEGISNEDQFQTLLELDCDYAQGYFIAKPDTAEALGSRMLA